MDLSIEKKYGVLRVYPESGRLLAIDSPFPPNPPKFWNRESDPRPIWQTDLVSDLSQYLRLLSAHPPFEVRVIRQSGGSVVIQTDDELAAYIESNS